MQITWQLPEPPHQSELGDDAKHNEGGTDDNEPVAYGALHENDPVKKLDDTKQSLRRISREAGQHVLEGNGAMNLSEFLAARPELQTGYQDFYLALWRSPHVPPRLLELCRLRTAYIHGCEAELAVMHAHVPVSQTEREALAAGDASQFDEAEAAALDLTEQMPFAHAQIDDAAVDRVRACLGNSGAVALVTALAFFDVTCRWKVTWRLSSDSARFDGTALC